VAIELGGCGVASVPEPRGRKPVGTAGVLSRAEFFTAQPLAHQKTIGRDAQTRVMMEAAPIAPPAALPQVGVCFRAFRSMLDAESWRRPSAGKGWVCAYFSGSRDQGKA